MNYNKILVILMIIIPGIFWGQEVNSEKNNKENLSQETVTKIIRIKGPNGEEKVIKQEQKITKKSALKLDPNDSTQTNQSVSYAPEVVEISNPNLNTENNKPFSLIPDGTGYIITIIENNIKKVGKVRPVKDDMYIVYFDKQNNFLGYFKNKNDFIILSYNPTEDKIETAEYKVGL